MSVIKFRAFVPEENKYIYSKDIDTETGYCFWFNVENGEVELHQFDEIANLFVKVLTAVIQLWSGMKDMHGKEIYEGDKIKVMSYNDTDLYYLSKVKFGEYFDLNGISHFGFYQFDGKHISPLQFVLEGHYEIIN